MHGDKDIFGIGDGKWLPLVKILHPFVGLLGNLAAQRLTQLLFLKELGVGLLLAVVGIKVGG